jgi:hypothetical protein
MNTTEIGNEFREYILDLLRSKFPDAHSEGKADWKNADIVFTMMELGKRIKVAVECKNYNRALNTNDFSKIVADYKSSLDKEINILLIISTRPIASASRQFVESEKNLRFMTVSELERWLVGLSQYVRTLAEEFNTDEVHHYYVEGRFEQTTSTAFAHINTWLNTSQNSGMAVLGGYGIGKSSLAKRVASEQAKRYLKDPDFERLPILIPLGQVVHETELAGLFGKHFTSHYVLENYSFNTLVRLNSAGRLLIILDGFDEMKHAMTEHDFRSNFREFNKLRTSRAKVLLLGRPSAFTSESSNLLIRGIGEIGGLAYSNHDFPTWQEQRLSFFSTSEQKIFLDNFLKHKSTAFADDEARQNRIADVMRDIDEDILQRPVQARIVGLLAADRCYNFKDASRFKLYSDFVRQVIHRDQEKRARSLIPAEDRHKFLRDLAWWAWTRPGVSQGSFRREEVPRHLFNGLSDGQAIDYQSKRTEYLVSSLTEEKDADHLYFAHRSFHEFLVSSYIISLNEVSAETITEISNALNNEVIDFLNEYNDFEYSEFIYQKLVEMRGGSISVKILDLLGQSNELIAEILKKPTKSIKTVDVLIIWRAAKYLNSVTFRGWMGNLIRKGSAHVANAAAFSLIDHAVRENNAKSHLAIELFVQSWSRILSGRIWSGDMETIDLRAENSKYCCVGEVLRNWTRKLRLSSGGRILINGVEAHKLLLQSLSSYKLSGIDPIPGKCIFEFENEMATGRMDSEDKQQFDQIYSINSDDFNLISKANRPRKSKNQVADIADDGYAEILSALTKAV